MGSRSRKRGRTDAPSPRDRMEAGYAKAEERNAAIRAGLEPYAPGERPTPLVVAVVLCVALALANLGLLVGGYDPRGASAGGAVVFAAILLVAAAGMWTKKYWAVLGFQALLAITAISGFLGLMVSGNVLAVVLCLVVIGLSGWLFWKLVRVLSRLQVPRMGTSR